MNIVGIGVEVAAKNEKLKSGLSASKNLITSFAKDSGQMISRALSGAFTAGFSILTKLTNEFKSTYDDLTRLVARSDYLGAPISDIQKLDYIANKTGISVGTLDTGMRFLNKNIGNAVRGFGTGVRALDFLGLSAEKLSKMPLTEQLLTVSDAINKVGNESVETSLKQDLLQETAMKANGAMKKISEAGAEFDKFGVKITEVDKRIIQMAMSSRAKFNSMWEGFRAKLAIPIIDALNVIMEKFSETFSANDILKFANTISMGILKGFRAIELGIKSLISTAGGLEVGLIRVLKLFNEIQTIKDAASGGFGDLGRRIEDYASLKRQGKSHTEAWSMSRQAADQAAGTNDPESFRRKAQLEQQEYEAKLRNTKNLYDTEKSWLDSNIRELERRDELLKTFEGRVQLVAGDITSLGKALKKNSTDYTNASLATTKLKEAMETASEKAQKFMDNPSFGAGLDKILKGGDVKQAENDIFNKLARETHDLIKQGTGGGMLAYANMQQMQSIMDRAGGPQGWYQEKGTDGKMGEWKKESTFDMQQVMSDLQNFQKQASLAKSKVEIKLDLSPDARRIFEVGGVYTDNGAYEILMHEAAAESMRNTFADAARSSAKR